jgi:hypothetical protein
MCIYSKMKTHIQNYGIAKTIIQNNHRKTKNAVKWMGDYDGNVLNMKLNIEDNGKKKDMKMSLDNEDLIKILNIQPHHKSIDERLMEDFIINKNKPISSFEIFQPKVLELIVSKKNKKSTKQRNSKKRKTRKLH